MDNQKKLKETDNINNEITDNPEAEEKLEKQDSVISEQIKPWHKRKFKKVMSVIGLSLLAGILFGVSARFVFKYSDGIISKIFGLSVQYDNVGGPGGPPPEGIPQPTGGSSGTNTPLFLILMRLNLDRTAGMRVRITINRTKIPMNGLMMIL